MAYTIDDFKYGDKVIPISKSVGDSFEGSYIVGRFKDEEVPYLKVTGRMSRGRRTYLTVHLPHITGTDTGDFFLPTDLEFYDEPPVVVEKQYVWVF